MKNKENIFNEKLNRITTTATHKEPDIVPVLFNGETWNFSYSGHKIVDIENDIQKEFQWFGKAFEDIYCDGTMMSALSREVSIYNSLGGSAYFYSEDGITLQHKEYVFMEKDEYPKLIKDPMDFTINEIFPRKYPKLNEPYPQNLEALKTSLKYYGIYIQKMMKSHQYSKETFGLPTLVGGIGQAPFDLIMDYYRGFKDIMGDIRRRPSEVKEATESLVPIIMASIKQGRPSLQPYPYVYFPLHAPTFLNRNQFEKLYWPTFRDVLYQVSELGGKALLDLQGNWEHLYDFINDFPKDFAIAMLEKDDILKAKKKIGDRVTICAGIEVSMLRNNSTEECIEHTKKIIDECASGGGFIFSTDKCLLAPGDVKIENLIAVNELVHSYGKY